jgi:hypothetical protein
MYKNCSTRKSSKTFLVEPEMKFTGTTKFYLGLFGLICSIMVSQS